VLSTCVRIITGVKTVKRGEILQSKTIALTATGGGAKRTRLGGRGLKKSRKAKLERGQEKKRAVGHAKNCDLGLFR